MRKAKAKSNVNASTETVQKAFTRLPPKPPKQALELLNNNGAKIPVYGSSYAGLEDSFVTPTVIIRAIDPWALDHDTTAGKIRMNPEAKAIFTTIHEPAIMEIIWSDGTYPSLGATFWRKLHAQLAELPDDAIVVVCCTGGTGRTGTMLSILQGLEYDDPNPVQTIRDAYTEHAVEYDVQVNYIRIVTDTKMPGVQGSYDKPLPLNNPYASWETKPGDAFNHSSGSV